MENNHMQTGKRLAFPVFEIGCPAWPADPHAPGFWDCPQPMYGFNCMGKIKQDGYWPKVPCLEGTDNRWPTDPHAPKGKKPVFIPLPDDLFSRWRMQDEEESRGDLENSSQWKVRSDRMWNLIEEQLNDDEMKKNTKKERIAALELKVEMLRDQIQDYMNATCRMQEQLGEMEEKEIEESLCIRVDIMPSTIRPSEGITHYGRYDGSPVLAWIADGKWWIQEANFAAEQPTDIEKLIWFKNTGTDK